MSEKEKVKNLKPPNSAATINPGPKLTKNDANQESLMKFKSNCYANPLNEGTIKSAKCNPSDQNPQFIPDFADIIEDAFGLNQEFDGMDQQSFLKRGQIHNIRKSEHDDNSWYHHHQALQENDQERHEEEDDEEYEDENDDDDDDDNDDELVQSNKVKQNLPAFSSIKRPSNESSGHTYDTHPTTIANTTTFAPTASIPSPSIQQQQQQSYTNATNSGHNAPTFYCPTYIWNTNSCIQQNVQGVPHKWIPFQSVKYYPQCGTNVINDADNPNARRMISGHKPLDLSLRPDLINRFNVDPSNQYGRVIVNTSTGYAIHQQQQQQQQQYQQEQLQQHYQDSNLVDDIRRVIYGRRTEIKDKFQNNLINSGNNNNPNGGMYWTPNITSQLLPSCNVGYVRSKIPQPNYCYQPEQNQRVGANTVIYKNFGQSGQQIQVPLRQQSDVVITCRKPPLSSPPMVHNPTEFVHKAASPSNISMKRRGEVSSNIEEVKMGITVLPKVKHFDLKLLEVGNFRVESHSGDRRRFSANLKVVFTKERLIYEFPCPKNMGGEADSTSTLYYAIIVTFKSITTINISDEAIYLVVKRMPQIYAGNSNSFEFNRVFGRDKDPSFGELRTNRLHRILLKTGQSSRLRSCLSEHNVRFKLMMSMAIDINPLSHRILLQEEKEEEDEDEDADENENDIIPEVGSEKDIRTAPVIVRNREEKNLPAAKRKCN